VCDTEFKANESDIISGNNTTLDEKHLKFLLTVKKKKNNNNNKKVSERLRTNVLNLPRMHPSRKINIRNQVSPVNLCISCNSSLLMDLQSTINNPKSKVKLLP